MTTTLDAAGAAELAGRIAAAAEAARNTASIFLVCSEDSLSEGAALQPAHEFSQVTETWTGVGSTCAQDLGAAAQLFAALSRQLDQLDTTLDFD